MVCDVNNSRSCIPFHQQLLRVSPDGSWSVTPIIGSINTNGPVSPRHSTGTSAASPNGTSKGNGNGNGMASPRGSSTRVYPPLPAPATPTLD